MPAGHFGLVIGRSSTLFNRKLFVNSTIIDEGYTGPLFIQVWNPNDHPILIKQWDRIAQLIVIPYQRIKASLVDDLPETERGDQGFGSTGT